MLINKVIFMSSFSFKLSIRVLLFSSILPIHHFKKMFLLCFGSEDFDVASLALCSVVLVTYALADFGPSVSLHSRMHET